MATPGMKLEADRLSSVILYLRLWKMCHMKLEGTSRDTFVRWFDVVPPPDEQQMLEDFRRLMQSKLEWAKSPDEIRSDIYKVLDFCSKENLTDQDLSSIEELQKELGRKALCLSGKAVVADPEIPRVMAAAAGH
jgi:hypothetical protein